MEKKWHLLDTVNAQGSDGQAYKVIGARDGSFHYARLVTGHGLKQAPGMYDRLTPATLGALEGMSLETMLLAPLAVVALLWPGPSGPGSQWPAHDAHTWLFFLLSGPVTAIPLLLFAAGARRVPLSTMGFLQYITPSILALMGVFLYGEPFAGPRAVGFVLIWVALVLYTMEGLWAGRRAAAAARAAA